MRFIFNGIWDKYTTLVDLTLKNVYQEIKTISNNSSPLMKQTKKHMKSKILSSSYKVIIIT
jgi:hypothetical protein